MKGHFFDVVQEEKKKEKKRTNHIRNRKTCSHSGDHLSLRFFVFLRRILSLIFFLFLVLSLEFIDK